MKTVLSLLLAVSTTLLTPQLAQACQSTKSFSRQDIAFADVIFEGGIRAIILQPGYVELTFDVQDVVRGELPSDEVTIGWKSQYYGGTRELALEEFKLAYGETTRVAISTPQLADRFCGLKLVYGSASDKETGKLVFEESMKLVCDTPAASLKSAYYGDMPFVLSNGYRCNSTYMYPAEMYEKMRDYDKNLAIFERTSVNPGTSRRKLFKDIVGNTGPLNWTNPTPHPKTIAARLFREQNAFFTPALKTNLVWQETLLDFGVEMMKESPTDYYTVAARYESALLEYRKQLRAEVLKLSDYSEKDPDFHARFLLED